MSTEIMGKSQYEPFLFETGEKQPGLSWAGLQMDGVTEITLQLYSFR